jgi:hypothetical protein
MEAFEAWAEENSCKLVSLATAGAHNNEGAMPRKRKPETTGLEQRGDRWLARVRVAGQKPRSKTFATEAQAAEWADLQRKELHRAKDADDGRDEMPLPPEEGEFEGCSRHTSLATGLAVDLIELYLDDPVPKARASFKAIQRELAWFVNKFGDEPVRTFLDRRHDAETQLRAKGYGIATVIHYMANLRKCWRWGQHYRKVPAHQVWAVWAADMLGKAPEREVFLAATQVQALLKSAEPDKGMAASLAGFYRWFLLMSLK